MNGQNPNHTPIYTPINGPIRVIYQLHFSSESYISPNKNIYNNSKIILSTQCTVLYSGGMYWYAAISLKKIKKPIK
jgi:hypothetical protein